MNAQLSPDQRSTWKWPLLTLAAVLFIILLARQAQRSNAQEVLVAANPITAGSKVDTSQLKWRKLTQGKLPTNVILDASVLEGRTLSRAKQAGEPFFDSDFEKTRVARRFLAEDLPAGRVLTTVGALGAKFPTHQLRQGDRFDIIAVEPGGVPQVAVRDAWLMGWISRKAPAAKGKKSLEQLLAPPTSIHGKGAGIKSGIDSFVFAIHPQSVLTLAQAQSSNAQLTFTLHGSKEVGAGNMLRIGDARRTTGVELIAGRNRTTVEVLR